jgi:chromosome segregation ATPase
MADPISPARQSLKQLGQHIAGAEEQIRRLEGSERQLKTETESLRTRIKICTEQLFEREEEVRKLKETQKELTSNVRDLTIKGEQGDNDLNRKLKDAEERASIHEARADDLTQQAALGVLLAETAGALSRTLDRLPETMDDAALIPTVDAKIPLYRTYDWQAVMDAQLAVKAAIHKGESDADSNDRS